ncbi:hypothetical protein C497_15922 [Halalkalicoccus jeotgali B3]|uniref:Uncharacterized protein n=1 Tax=Halalkalicoccus jeotgali (strain DSM 18796 / CECT 7217 / JCM 14584 / KCTC 4019 / B3) TaxID=795797 RepID=D8J7H5_HALJB|nr:hypothetical protein HacjB3_03385 [Halalkalicoccus jeotgali B3]ELY33886.1 hypothetical protein C497_15922 [Halalkalicoccus jeotgali B3]
MEFTCTDCTWATSGTDDGPDPVSKRAIEHHIACGHHVTRVDVVPVSLTDPSKLRFR